MGYSEPQKPKCSTCLRTFDNLRLLSKHDKLCRSTRADTPARNGSNATLGRKRNFTVMRGPSTFLARSKIPMQQLPADMNMSEIDQLEVPVNHNEGTTPSMETGIPTWSPGGLCSAVSRFFECFEDVSRPLYAAQSHDDSQNSGNLNPDVTPLIEHCLRNRMSRQSSCQEYNMVLSLVERWSANQSIPEFSSLLSKLREDIKTIYPTPRSFANRVALERKILVSEQKWHIALIKNRHGKEQTGVFIPIMDAIQSAVDEGGGLDKLVGYKEKNDEHGVRCFSKPQDSEALRLEELESWRYSKPRVYFTLYCDGTMLAKSGAGNGTMVRMRLDNLPGLNKTWYDVGIAPNFDIGGRTDSDAVIRDGRLELFHRFLFLVLKSAGRTSEVQDKFEFAACLLSIQADRPQEREFLCLMGSGCEQDCSICCCRTLEEKRFQQSRRSLLSNTEQDENLDILQRLPVPPIGGTTDNSSYEPRDVLLTVKTQLEVALYEKTMPSAESLPYDAFQTYEAEGISHLSTTEYRHRKKWLHNQSARKLPTSLAALDGLASPPFRLFSIAGLDLLHCLYLGPVRQFSDNAFKVFQKKTFSNSRPKARLVRSANNRIVDLPASSACKGMRPFKGVETDKQASFTGKQRRDLLPFLWYAVLGLNERRKPDEDPLLRVALQLDWLHVTVCGINSSPTEVVRSAHVIRELQTRCRLACDEFMHCFGAYETSKLHQLRVHLADQLQAFGSFRYSDTGINEALHKGVKKSYLSTNKRLREIAPQLLKVNVAAEVIEKESRGEVVSSMEQQLLLTRDPRVTAMTSETPGEALLTDLENRNDLELEVQMAREVERVLQVSRIKALTPSESVNLCLTETDAFGYRMFQSRKSVMISAHFEWLEREIQVRQVLYATDAFGKRGPRYDGVRFVHKGCAVFGFLEAIIERKYTSSCPDLAESQIALVRELVPVPAQAGNINIVNEFGYERFKYKMTGEDIFLLAIPIKHIQRRAVIVYDAYHLAPRYGYDARVSEIEDTKEERKAARFFHAKNMKYTSIGEASLELEDEDLEGRF